MVKGSKFEEQMIRKTEEEVHGWSYLRIGAGYENIGIHVNS